MNFRRSTVRSFRRSCCGSGFCGSAIPAGDDGWVIEAELIRQGQRSWNHAPLVIFFFDPEVEERSVGMCDAVVCGWAVVCYFGTNISLGCGMWDTRWWRQQRRYKFIFANVISFVSKWMIPKPCEVGCVPPGSFRSIPPRWLHGICAWVGLDDSRERMGSAT